MKKLNKEQCYILESSNLIFFDVDDTLVLWTPDKDKTDEVSIKVRDPYMPGENHFLHLTPHRAHINILKRNYAQGRTVVVWSAAGHLWAKRIVEALKLSKYVTLIMDKPALYVDDTPMEVWGPKRIFLPIDLEGKSNVHTRK